VFVTETNLNEAKLYPNPTRSRQPSAGMATARSGRLELVASCKRLELQHCQRRGQSPLPGPQGILRL